MRGPLFNDPGPPPAPSGSPCPELWEFEGEGYYKNVQIGGFHAISGDTNNNGEMNKCWWTNKVS